MKRYKRLLVLVVLLAVATVATLILTQYEQKQEQIRTSDAVILQIPSDTVTALSWEYASGDSLSFYNSGSGWKYEQDEAFPVSEEKVDAILAHFESYGVSFAIEDVEDYAQYGLDDPQCILHLQTEGCVYDIKIGSFSKMDQQRYIDIGDGNAYLVSEDPLEYVDSELSSMIENDDTPSFESVVDITFEGSSELVVSYAEDSTDTYLPQEDVFFTENDGKTVPLDSDLVRRYLNTVTSLSLRDYVTYNATDEELESFGLDAPLLSVSIRYTFTGENGENEADTCVLYIGENRQERASSDASVAEGGEELAVTTYVRIGDSQIVYTLDSADYAILSSASYDDLRHKEVFWADFDAVSRMDVSLEGNTHTLSAVFDEDGNRCWYFANENEDSSGEADAQEEERLDLSDFESALLALYADSFTDAPAGEVEEIGLTLYLDDENFPKVEISLYRCDGSSCLAVVDGKSVSYVPRASVMKLVETVQTIVLR